LADIKDFTFLLDIRKDLYFDSLSLTVLITSIEQEFNTIFDDDDEVYENISTLGQVVDLLMKD
jgi:acyl carrier protein